MRGHDALKWQALGLFGLTSSPLVDARAIEPAVEPVAPPPSDVVVEDLPVNWDPVEDVSRYEDDDTAGRAGAYIDLEFHFADDDGGNEEEHEDGDGDGDGDGPPGEDDNSPDDDVNRYGLHLNVYPKETGDSPCTPGNISVNGNELTFDADGSGHGSIEAPHSTPFEAIWSILCLTSESGIEGVTGVEPSQLLSFDVISLGGRPIKHGEAGFVAQIRQGWPAEVLTVAGPPVSVQILDAAHHDDDDDNINSNSNNDNNGDGSANEDGHDGDNYGYDRPNGGDRKALRADIRELEDLRRQLMEAEKAVFRKEIHIADTYGPEGADAAAVDFGEHHHSRHDGKTCSAFFKGSIRKVIHGVKGTAKKIYAEIFGSQGGRGRLSFSESSGWPPSTIQKAKHGAEHPIADGHGKGNKGSHGNEGNGNGKDEPDVKQADPQDGNNNNKVEGDESSSWDGHNHHHGRRPPASIVVIHNILVMALVIAIVALIHRCCVGCRRDRRNRNGCCGRDSRERQRRREERRARNKKRREALRLAIRRFFMSIFCRSALEDEEKEAERRRMLDEGMGPSDDEAGQSRHPIRDEEARALGFNDYHYGGPGWAGAEADVDVEGLPAPRRSGAFSVHGGRASTSSRMTGVSAREGGVDDVDGPRDSVSIMDDVRDVLLSWARGVRPRARDAESITLVGSGTESEMEYDGDEEEEETRSVGMGMGIGSRASFAREDVESRRVPQMRADGGHSLPDSESEDGDADADAASESGGSVMSSGTTMEMDLARFREATFMVGDMVAAGSRRREEMRRGQSQSQRASRRSASPSGSLPGYASDDPYPPSSGHFEGQGPGPDTGRGEDANGFQYQAVMARASDAGGEKR